MSDTGCSPSLEATMTKELLYIGIDYHTTGVQLCAMDQSAASC